MENFSTQKLSSQNHNPIFYANSKTLSSATSKKDLGAADTQMRAWIEDAQQYLSWYQGVVAGEIKLQPGEELPSSDQMAQFQEWYQWATGGKVQQWDPSVQQPANFEDSNALPPGSKLGPMNNIVFNGETAQADYQASKLPIDVLSDEFTLNVGVKAKVDVEATTDTRIKPETGVLKITIHDPSSTPSETVYFVNPEAKININTIGGKSVTQHGTASLNLADGTPQITVGTYQATSTDVDSEANNPVGKKNAAGEMVYKGSSMEDVLDFHPQDSGKAGDLRTSIVFGNCNISLDVTDHVKVTKQSDGSINVEVQHNDGSKDTSVDIYKIQKGFKLNLNANPTIISYGILGYGPVQEGGDMPEDLAGLMTVNGGKMSSTEDSTPSVDTSGDTQANPGSVKNGKATYSKSEDVELHTDFGDKTITDSKIIATSTMTLHVDYSDSVKVTRNSTAPYTYTITVTQDGTGKQKTYTVQGPKKIVLDAFNVDRSGVPADDTVLQVGSADPTDAPDNATDTANKIKGSDIVTNVPSDPSQGPEWNTNESLELAEAIGEGLQSNVWDKVGDYFGKASGWNIGNKNNVVRKIITALYKAAGSDNDVFMALLKKIPVTVRNTLKDWATHHDGELNESGEIGLGEQWNTAGAAAKISESLV